MTKAKFKVGDYVKCSNPNHQGSNPFRISQKYQRYEYLDDLTVWLYYQESKKCPPNHSPAEWNGCREDWLTKVKPAKK